VGQSGPDELVDFGIIHFALQGAFPPSPLSLLLGLTGVVFLTDAVASQFTADGRRRTVEGFGNLLLIKSPMPQLRYAITLFQRKMTGHRWDSIPKGKVCKTPPIGNSQRCFLLDHFSEALHSSLDCISDLRPPGNVTDDVLTNLTWQLTLTATGLVPVVPAPLHYSLASGLGEALDVVLGRIDTTLLANGPYRLELTALDSGGNSATARKTVRIDSRLKLGNFTVSFTDLEVPVVGIPITVTRTYDTLRAGHKADFGYGWELDFSNTRLQVEHPAGSFGAYPPFRDGTRVTVTLPDGNVEGFTFYGQPLSNAGLLGSLGNDYLPRFVPDVGVKSELIVSDVYLIKAGANYLYPFDGRTYNPADPIFQTDYLLKTRSGHEFLIDSKTGDLLSITDRNGNTVFFHDDGIESSTGRGLTIERDATGFIQAIIDPAGNAVRYRQNSKGDLVRVTDRVGAKVDFTYRPDRPHYLEDIIDPLGRTAAKTEYYPDGRMVRSHAHRLRRGGASGRANRLVPRRHHQPHHWQLHDLRRRGARHQDRAAQRSGRRSRRNGCGGARGGDYARQRRCGRSRRVAG
jgi:hypothetical protein